jgi:hypothetical protein
MGWRPAPVCGQSFEQPGTDRLRGDLRLVARERSTHGYQPLLTPGVWSRRVEFLAASAGSARDGGQGSSLARRQRPLKSTDMLGT